MVLTYNLRPRQTDRHLQEPREVILFGRNEEAGAYQRGAHVTNTDRKQHSLIYSTNTVRAGTHFTLAMC